MSRSKDPLMYDDTWSSVLEFVKKGKSPLVLRSSLKKAATLNLEWHCYRAAWKHQSEKAETAFLRGTKSPLAPEFSELRSRALENYRALCSYHSEVNRVLNQLVLRYRGGESTTLSIGDEEQGKEQSSERPFNLSYDPRPLPWPARDEISALITEPRVFLNPPAGLDTKALEAFYENRFEFHLDEFNQLWAKPR